MRWLTFNELLTLQRHFSALPKFAHVESRFCGRKRRGKALFDVPINPCVRDTCSKSVAVGLIALTIIVGAFLTMGSRSGVVLALVGVVVLLTLSNAHE
jgi:hypothetical protein